MPHISKILLILILILSLIVRIWDLTKAPPSLYWDEMDAGYQAYSILKTGKDYFGNTPGLVAQSFADYRAPILIYSLIPSIALLGLNSFAVRLPAALFGVICVFLIFVLGRTLFKSRKIGLIAALLLAFEPWSIQYSRMSFEVTLMLALFLGGSVCFFKGFNRSIFWIFSGLLFGLSILTYNTAKLFVPLVCIALFLIYIKKNHLSKNFLIGSGILGLIFLVSLYSSIFQGGGKRFSEISILTDPQISAKIDNDRSQSALSYTQNREAGQSVRQIDQAMYNKFSFIIDRVTQNYLTAFSPQFLFITGDPNLRHSPEKIGELYRVEIIAIIFGLGFLFVNYRKNKSVLLLLGWIIFAPLPAVITRDGGFHATRLAFLFPALCLVAAVGIQAIWQLLPKKINMITIGCLASIWLFNVAFFINYYFGAYRIESARYFQYGFPEAVKTASKYTQTQDYVIIDDRRDSALMNYLFEQKFDPSLFQKQVKSSPFEIAGAKSSTVGNIIFMDPGIRDWPTIFAKNLIDKNFLLIVSAQQLEEQTIEKVPEKLTKNQKLIDTIYYQNGDVAFYVIENKQSFSESKKPVLN